VNTIVKLQGPVKDSLLLEQVICKYRPMYYRVLIIHFTVTMLIKKLSVMELTFHHVSTKACHLTLFFASLIHSHIHNQFF